MWRFKYWCKILLFIFLVVWISISFYTIGPLWKTNQDSDHLMVELIQANEEIENLRNTINELSQKYKQSTSQQKNKQCNSPSKEYELTRRRLYRDINEYWWYIQGFLETFSSNDYLP